jgi:hypothetical protein
MVPMNNSLLKSQQHHARYFWKLARASFATFEN